MSRDARLRRAAQATIDFDLTGSNRDHCDEAYSLQLWATDVCRAAIAHGELVALKQAKLRLTERYFARRPLVQRRHRALSGRTDHICLHDVFVAAFEHLDEAEQNIRPPVIEVTRTIVSAPPRSSYDALFIGDVRDEEFE